jgi:hypothetical protein
LYDKLWQPVALGNVKLEHRLVMAPMTRNRSTPEGIPTTLNATYYAQRAADAALIITEGVQPSADGQGYLLTPGIHTQAYERGVKLVGATAHYVTADLDEGPIIEQTVTPVNHSMTAEDCTAIGQDTECLALAHAVRWHSEDRVLLDGKL